MGKSTGFKEFKRKEDGYISVKNRISNYKEFTVKLEDKELKKQGSRCMDCGIPFCHSSCPLGNLIPDFNLVWHREWQEACDNLHSTNNFPEFTGKICPAPCESACTLNLYEEPVSIKTIECAIIVEKGFENGWIRAKVPKKRTNNKIAIIGSGPAGLAAAEEFKSWTQCNCL